MRKILRSIAAGVMALCSISSWAFDVGDLSYTVVSEADKTVEVARSSSGSYAAASYVIPPTVENGGTTYTVIGIANMAFQSSTTTSVELPATLTYLGSNAFMSANKITSIVIPDNVKTIGKWGLRGMSACTSITLPAELTAVPDGMCWGNTKLKGIVIPDKVTTIGENAFASCSGLDSVVIGASVTELKLKAFAYAQSYTKMVCRAAVPPTCGDNAIYGNAFTKATLYVQEKSLQAYNATEPWSKFAKILAYDPSGSSDDDTFVVAGVTYRQLSKQDKTVCVIYNDTLAYKGDIVIRDTVNYASVNFAVVSVADGAFRNSSGMITLVLPSSVANIGANAFEGCTGLKYLTEYATVPPALGANALAGINKTLCTLFVTDDVRAAYAQADQWKEFTKVGLILLKITVDDITYQVSSVTEATLEMTSHPYPGKYEGALTIPSQVDYKGLKFTVVGIGSNAFYASDVTSLQLPSTLRYIANNAFYGAGKYNAPIETLVLPEGLTTIAPSAFYAAHIKYVELPKHSLTTLGASAFYACDIRGIKIPASIGKIGSGVFGASDLQWVEIEDGITEIGESAFYGTDLGQVTIPNSVTTLGKSAFGACTGLASVTFGTGLTTVGDNAFYGTSNLYKVFSYLPAPPASLEAALAESGKNIADRVTYAVSDKYTNTVAWGNVKVRSDLNKMFDVDGIRYLPAADGSATVDAVDCSYDRNVNTINVVDQITHNGKTYEVTSLANALAMGNPFMLTVSYRSKKAMPVRFACSAKNLKTVNLPDDMQTISAYGFSSCDSLKTIKLPSNLRTLDIAAFYFAGLDSLSIPGNVTLIDNAAIAGCRKLQKFVLEDGPALLLMGFYPTMMGNNPMFMASPLKEVVIGRPFNTAINTAQYGYSPFYNDTVLEKVTITNYTTDITDHMFGNCKRLKTFKAGDALATVYSNAFTGCAALEDIYFGYGLKQIGGTAFDGCAGVKTFTCAANKPPKCYTNAFGSIDKNTCTLYVKNEAVADYKKAAQWQDFFHIVGKDLGVSEIITDGNINGYEVWDLNGVRILFTRDAAEVDALPEGIYIINGRKVMICK